MITTEHIALLLQIKESKNPNWVFLSNNYPEGMLWNSSKVAKLLNDLKQAGMVSQIDAQSNALVLPSGDNEIDKYLRQ